LTAALLLAAPRSTSGHPLSVSYSRFDLAADAVTATVRLPLDDVDLLLQLDQDLAGGVSADEIRAAREAIAAYVLPRVALSAGGRPLTLSVSAVGAWLDGKGFSHLEVGLRGEAPPSGPIDIRVTVLTDLYSEHRNLAEAVTGSHRRQFVFQHGNRWRVEGAGSARWTTVREFTRLGLEHIFTGYDHVLFLVGLLIVSRGLRTLVAIVTSFTAAHSITLALATLRVVEPVGWAVEAAIALSIAYVGLENLVATEVRHRWLITFAFGLVHGLGFAGVLREMDLERRGLAASLIGFNLGVEVGQVAIVALLWPLLRLLHRTPHRDRVVRLASAVIVACGVFWFVERIA
jgi:hypothetical protein